MKKEATVRMAAQIEGSTARATNGIEGEPVRAVTPAAVPNALLVVARWELSRIMSARSTWLTLMALMVLVVLVLWLRKEITVGAYFLPQEERINVGGTSAWGMVYTMPVIVLMVGMIAPFLSADGVARDLKQRTHELLMSTSIPSWAYVWGRFVAVLVLNLLLAAFMLVAILLTGVVFTLALGYPLPNVAAMLSLWAVAVVPAVVLLSGVSFALGTLFPRYSSLVKALVLLVWFLMSYEGLLLWGSGNDPSSVYWDPTSRAMVGTLGRPYRQALFSGIETAPLGGPGREGQAVVRAGNLTPEEKVRELRRRMPSVEQQAPDLGPWLVPHLALGALGLAAPAVGAARFRRFNGLT